MDSKQILIAFLFTVSFSSCINKPQQLGVASTYFAPSALYAEGVVSKFYRQATPTNKNATSSMDIRYLRYQFQAPDILYCDEIDAAFKLRKHKEYQIKEDKMILLDYYEIFRGDTCEVAIKDNVELNWKTDEAVVKMKRYFRKTKTELNSISELIGVSDTIVENMPCKNILWKSSIESITEVDTMNFSSLNSSYYAKGIGFFGEVQKYESYHYSYELIEQMSIADFEKKKANAKKRIAYIDPSNTIDDNPDFKLCGKENEIDDYYNRDQRAGLNGGKGSWWRILERMLKPEKLHNESGYLTFRFVINCEGTVGRFITEQADLNFVKKEFNSETINHLYEIVSSQKDWLPSGNENGLFDSYVYVTFKLKDGKIIELLP